MLRHLPPESSVAAIQRGPVPHWSLEAHLLDDLRLSLTGSKEKPPKPHPLRRQAKPAKRPSPERRKKLAEARRRAHERRLAIEAGEIT